MRSRPSLLAAMLWTLIAAPRGEAQPRPDGSSGGGIARVSLRDYAERRFAASDGLRSMAVFAVTVTRDGSLWIGTEAGPHRMDGARFEHVPLPIANTHVRVIAQTADDAIWFGTRLGVVRRAPDATITLFDADDGLPTGTVFSLEVTDAIDGTDRLVAATSTGLAYLRDSTWVELSVPDGIRPEGLVIAARPRPNRTDELWVGAAVGAAARWADGEWRAVYHAAAGLDVRGVERFMVLKDSSATLLAATSDGVYQFEDSGPVGRWRHMPGSPNYAYRLAWMPGDSARAELWVGTLDGLLVRRRAARWDTVPLRSTDPRTPVHALLGVPGHAGGFGVYVGTFGDGLVRLTVGRASTLISPGAGLRLSINAVLEEPLGVPGTAWLSTAGFGVVEVAGNRVGTVLDRDALVDGRSTALYSRQLGDGRHEAWVGAMAGVRQYLDGRWITRDGALGRVQVLGLAPERQHDPTSPMLVASDSGVHAWRGDDWERLAGSPREPVYAVLGESRDDATLWLAGPFGTMARRNGVWTRDDSNRALGLNGLVRRFCRLAGSDLLLVGGDNGLLVRSPRDRTWQRLPSALRERLPSETVYDIRCDDPAQVLVATIEGLMVLDLQSEDPAAWRFLSTLGPADGLPSPLTQSIGQGGSPGARWIGTAQGLGRVDLATLPMAAPSAFTMEMSIGLQGAPLLEGARVPFKQNRVTLRLRLPTFHREEDSRFLVEIDGPTSVPPATWTPGSETTFSALTPGRYTVRARARDYAGVEYGPLVQSFSVGYPPWRSPLALAAFALTALLLAVAAHRWRLRTISARAGELQASERRARASEAQFRTLFERAHDASLLVRNGQVVAANSAAEHLLARADRQLLGAPVGSIGVRDTGATAERDAWETTVMRGPTAAIPVAVSVTEVAREDGPLQHWVLRDLSGIRDAEAERRLLESQVREAQKLESLGTLAGGVAHDFNNLLGVIRGNAELAREALDDPDEVADHLAAVLDASERARDLVRQILTFSRRTTPHEGVVDLGAVVRTIVPMLRSLIPRSVELTVTGGDASLPVRGDLTQLQQLLFNLCSNAEYAMRPKNGGQLSISLTSSAGPDGMIAPSGRVVTLRVSDSGVGMSPDVRARVFEPFFTTKPTGEGTGLGLSVLHGIVASHGGRARVESTEGVGSTFEVVFPLLDDAEVEEAAHGASAPGTSALGSHGSGAHTPGTTAAGAPTARSARSADGAELADVIRGAQVVLVDDEPAVARVVERALTRLGCRVRTFSDSQEALAHLMHPDSVVDLVVTDQTMPGITGDDLSEAVHRVRPTLPVILVTGYSYRLTPERLAEVGATAVLQKPVPLDLLTYSVRTALQDRTPNASSTR